MAVGNGTGMSLKALWFGHLAKAKRPSIAAMKRFWSLEDI